MSELRPEGPAPTIVGLGNPGPEYAATRHSLGFAVVDELARRHGTPAWRVHCGALLTQVGGVQLVKPQTFMNRSGFTARCMLERGELEPERTLVVFDDVSLPLGSLRLRASGGPGGHRGLESLIEHLRTSQVPRLKLGIADGRERTELSDFVLGLFLEEERPRADEMIARAADACEMWVEHGLDRAASQFNGAPG